MQPGRPLIWRPPPIVERGRAGCSCFGERPAALLDAPSSAAIVAETLSLIRESRAEAARDLGGYRDSLTLLAMHAEDARDDLQEDALASLAALSHALAQEGTAMGALDRLMGAVVLCEARALRGDPVGAALMLCRWLERLRKTGLCATVEQARPPAGATPRGPLGPNPEERG